MKIVTKPHQGDIDIFVPPANFSGMVIFTPEGYEPVFDKKPGGVITLRFVLSKAERRSVGKGSPSRTANRVSTPKSIRKSLRFPRPSSK